METIVLYSTGCPQCKVLKSRLDAANIMYEENHSVDEMLELGITNVPVLKVDERLLNFRESLEWVNKKKEAL